MGNMSNPCINRWGLNSFWHHFWYSDSSYSLYAKQDAIMLSLLKIYLNYGSTSPLNLFYNKYWFKHPKDTSIKSIKPNYRVITVFDKTVKTTTSYRMRLSHEETFNTKVSVLRYNSWIVLNSYWFQPDKKKKYRKRKAKIKDYLIRDHGLLRTYSDVSKSLKMLQTPVIYNF